MSYSQFTIAKVKEDFQLTLIEGGRFFPPTAQPIVPSPRLTAILEETPWAIAVDTEKARSEVLINPVMLEVRRILQNQISVFSGEEFNVEPEVGLNGVCDFLISRTSEQLTIEAPVVVLVEAKKSDLKSGLGQCIAEMIAAARFNAKKNCSIPCIYGSVSSGTQWRFLKLEGSVVSLDLTDYALDPVDQILGFFTWMVREG